MNFDTGLPVSNYSKSESYDLTIGIFDRLSKMVNYELVKVTIDALILTKVIINIVVGYYGLSDLIISN